MHNTLEFKMLPRYLAAIYSEKHGYSISQYEPLATIKNQMYVVERNHKC